MQGVFRLTFAAALLAALTALAGALAHEGASGIVKARMELMKDMAGAMKALAPGMRGKAAWDPALVRDNAAIIADHAKDIPERFPEGSGKPPSEALPAIWENWETFEEDAQALQEHAETLESRAAKGAEAARPVFAKIIDACKGCHEEFRQATD